jgi:MFS family permease
VSGGSTALLCVMVFANTVCVGAFGPLLPDIARAQELADWQLGLLAGSFGFARMIADVPTGLLAGRRLGITLAAAPVLLVAGTLLLWTAGPFPLLVLGRGLIGLGHTLGMVGGLTAILLDHRGAAGSMRLNVFEFAGMAGVLGGLAAVGLLPASWGWPRSLLVACSPVLITLAIMPRLRRAFPDAPAPASPAGAAQAGSRAPGERGRAAAGFAAAAAPRPFRVPAIVGLMFGVGIVMGVAWSSVSQFLIPLRGTREFGLDRAGVSRLLALSQVVDLLALLPVGWLADRVGRVLMLSALSACLALGAWAVALGGFAAFAAGCVLLGLGMAGWMFPLGIIREHTDAGRFAFRTGLYRVGIDAAAFLGPLACGVIGEAHTGFFIGLVGLAALGVSARLGWIALR